MSSAVSQRSTRTTPRPPSLQIEFIALIFGTIGFLLLALTFYLILSDESIFGPDAGYFGRRVWNLLQSVGVIRPVLSIVAGLLFIRLGWLVHTRYIGAARWARSVLLWLLVLAGLGIAQIINEAVNSETLSGQAAGSDFVISIAPWGAGILLLFSLLVILNRNTKLFVGDEHITAQRTRTAWNLLAPTLIIFLLIGIGPLEQVFITSLTNERFARSDEVSFVGLSNYEHLLGLRLDILPCETDLDTNQCLTETDSGGNTSVIYPRARRYLTDNVENYREQEFRPMNEYSLFGKRYVLSARDPEFIDAFVTSLIYAVVAIFLQLVIGMFMAIVLTVRLRGMSLLRVAMLVPLAIPTLIATQFWDVMLLPNETGIMNSALLDLGLINQPQQWLLDSSLQLPAVILVIVWKETPSMALLLLPGLLSISPEIYQAAAVDGANRWQQFWRITLPIMRPTIGVALVLRTMVMLRVFDVFEILLGARKFSMATYAYNTLIQRQELGYSSTISVAIFVIILFFTVIYMRSLRIDES